MYVRDELGVFPECAYSLLLSISFLLTHREAVISNSWSPPRFVLGTSELFTLLVVCVRFINTFALRRVVDVNDFTLTPL